MKISLIVVCFSYDYVHHGFEGGRTKLTQTVSLHTDDAEMLYHINYCFSLFEVRRGRKFLIGRSV